MCHISQAVQEDAPLIFFFINTACDSMFHSSKGFTPAAPSATFLFYPDLYSSI